MIKLWTVHLHPFNKIRSSFHRLAFHSSILFQPFCKPAREVSQDMLIHLDSYYLRLLSTSIFSDSPRNLQGQVHIPYPSSESVPAARLLAYTILSVTQLQGHVLGPWAYSPSGRDGRVPKVTVRRCPQVTTKHTKNMLQAY